MCCRILRRVTHMSMRVRVSHIHTLMMPLGVAMTMSCCMSPHSYNVQSLIWLLLLGISLR